MKVFFKKLHRTNKPKAIIYYTMTIIYFISLCFFTYSLSRLTGIENLLRLIISLTGICWLIAYLIITPVKIITRKNKSFIVLTVITSLLIPIFLIVAAGIIFIRNGLDFTKDYLTYTTNLITLNDTEINSNSKLGMINEENDIEGFQLAKSLYDQSYSNYELVNYDDYYEMLADLYNHQIDAIFISSNYTILFASEKLYENIASETKVIDTFSKKQKNQDLEIKSSKKLSEPFTILLMGVDSEIDGLDVNQAFNGDTLMMITFNPKTLTATMFSMPRDMYVPITCRNNNYAKVNSSAAYGTSCVKSTLENITGIPIDYYIKMNFKGVVDLVEAVNGITVDVEKPDYNYNHGYDCKGMFCEQNSNRAWGKNTIYLSPGVQTLNGEQALAYARCRALYFESDIARNRHQQQIVEALAKKASTIRSLNSFQNILNAVSKNMDTNISTDQILSFYEVAKDMIFKDNNSDELISIQKTYLQYYDLPVYLPGSDTVTSALGYYESSLDAIKKAMRINLELEQAQMNKSFSFSFNENYESEIIGKGLIDNSRIETMPSFINKTIDEAKSWAQKHDIEVNIEYVDSTSEFYNPNVLPGTIANQSIHRGSFLTNISTITFYINSNTPPTDDPNDENNNFDENDNNQNDDSPEDENTPPEINIPGSPTVE